MTTANPALKPHEAARTQEETPPHSLDAEKGVIGSMIDVHEGAIAFAQARSQIDADYFYIPAHRTIFGALCAMRDEGSCIDLITVTQWLRDSGELEKVGGPAYVTELATFVPTAANVRYYIDIVRDKYVLRETRRAAEIAIQRTKEVQEEGESSALDELESRIASLRSLHGRNGAQISFRSPSEILAMPRNPKANFLGDKLLGIARSLVLAGIGGLGKSRLVLQLLVAFILERIWCGTIETHHTKGKPWMLIQTQNGNDRLQDDLEPLKNYAGCDWPLVEGNLKVHTLETDRDLMLHLSDPKNVRDLENEIRRCNPIGVAFDPLNEFAVGDLSKDVDMTATCTTIGSVARAGNPDRAIVIATHALTGLAGMKKAFGFEAAGFGRNSKVLHNWSRAFINIIPGKEDYSVLVLLCGKNNDGQMFSPFAVRLNPETMLYEPEPDFDIEELRDQLSAKPKRFPVGMLHDLKFKEMEISPLAKFISNKLGCSRSRSYELAREGVNAKILKFNKLTDTYAKI